MTAGRGRDIGMDRIRAEERREFLAEALVLAILGGEA